ncbi:MAG: MarR family transcriptional regulator [Thermoanaerobaculia bacterium]|nr:MarR family transcriptional regulator [Thermoanaerobaculia bacterium]
MLGRMDTPTSLLREEIQQNRPFRSASQEATLGLFRTTSLVRRLFSRIVEPKGITLQQYNVLRILRGAGPDGLPTLAISERMVERMPGITRLVDRLEEKALVARERSTSDRRLVLCRITPGGLALLDELEPAIYEADDRCLDMLSTAEQRELIRLLDKIRAAYAERGGEEE